MKLPIGNCNGVRQTQKVLPLNKIKLPLPPGGRFSHPALETNKIAPQLCSAAAREFIHPRRQRVKSSKARGVNSSNYYSRRFELWPRYSWNLPPASCAPRYFITAAIFFFFPLYLRIQTILYLPSAARRRRID